MTSEFTGNSHGNIVLTVVFKVAMLVQNPAKCEVHAEIQFLHTRGETAAEIHRQLVSVYGKNVMNRQNMAKWYREFEAGRSDEMSGKPSVATVAIIQTTDENICADRRLTFDELHQQCPEVSRTAFHEIVTKRLGCRKLCTCWVLKMLTDDHKKNQAAATQAFLTHYEDQGDDILDCFVMGDETWVSHLTHLRISDSAVAPHTLNNSEKIQNLTIKPKNHDIHLLEQEGATSRQFFASRRQHQCCCLL
jgi:hypothetical protein